MTERPKCQSTWTQTDCQQDEVQVKKHFNLNLTGSTAADIRPQVDNYNTIVKCPRRTNVEIKSQVRARNFYISNQYEADFRNIIDNLPKDNVKN